MKECISYILIFFLWLGFPTCMKAQQATSAGTKQDGRPAVEGSLSANTESVQTKIPIIPSEPFDTTSATLNEPTLSLQLQDNNAVYSVGTPEGTTSVSNSGAAVYSMKIEVPNGGSLTPQIELSYNSQSSGYGLAGYGFNITGISAITRGGHDLFHDAKQTGVTYTTDDNLFLDGKRLILQSDKTGQEDSYYTVEGDPFTKVIAHNSNNGSTTWFEVTTNTGMTYQYGNSPNSRITYVNKSGNSHIASWYVNQATDKYSNYITYQYAISDLSIRPTAIVYGTNSKYSRGIVNEIYFAYKSIGVNARPFVIEDQQGKTDMCLSSVTTLSNNSIYRKYSFTYNENSDQSFGKWTRLVSVEESNGKGEKFPPVTFTWQYLPSSEIHTSQLAVSTDDSGGDFEESDKQFMSVDLNGDGFSDIIRVSTAKYSYGYETRVYVSRSKVSSTGSITYDLPIVYRMPSSYTPDDKKIKFMLGGTNVMDYDGDGYNDLIFPLETVQKGNGIVVFYVVAGRNVVAGEGGVLRAAFSMNPKSGNKVPLFVNMDVDGNGTDDLIGVEQNKKDDYYPCTILQYKSDWPVADLTELELTLPEGVSKDIEKIFVGDYNNDGLSDLILLYDGGYKIYFNNGGTTASSRFTESNTKSGTDFGDYWRILQGDFDGDGLLDFVYNKKGDPYLWIAHNNGNGTFSSTKSADLGITDHASSKDDNRFAILANDIDHDGRTDVIVCKAGYKHRGFPKFKNEYRDTQVRWLYSTGSGLKSVYNYTKKREDDAKEGTIFLGDFDGDGYPELANYGSLLNSTDDTFSEKINVYKAGGDLSQMGKITCVSDGMGNHTSIRYASSTSPEVYKKSIASKYPVNTYTLPLSVVAQIISDNGASGSQTAKYSYEDLRLHIAGRGMLGFNTITTENTTLGTKEVSSITKWDESLWIPEEVKVVYSIGNNSSTTVSTYSISKSNNNYFAFVCRKATSDLDGNTVITTSKYDITKGVILEETVSNDGGNMYKKVDYSDYQDKAGVWMPETLTMTQKHADDPKPYTSVTKYCYDDKGNVISSTTNYGTDLALTTASTYDAYGNVISSVTSGRDVKKITKYNDYDESGRFVKKSYTSPSSSVNTFTYDLWGNLLTVNDETDASNILTTTYTYDGWGSRLTALQADGTRTTYETGWGTNDSHKYYTKESTTGKPPVTTWYDKGGHEVLQETFGIKGLPISKTTTYNSNSQISRVENKTGKLILTRNLTYDERGRVATDVQSSGKSVSYSYGNRSVTMTTAGRSYTKVFDAWGNVIRSTDPICEVVYQYSSVGKPSSVTTQGSTVTMTYDAAGNQKSMSDPDAGTSQYTYAADGTLQTQTDGRGIETNYHYDDLGRLASTQIGQSSIAYTYGTTGNEKLRLTKLSVGNHSVEYTHDRFGRVVTEKRNVDGYGTYCFSYAYNSNNQLVKTTYPGGLEESYQYDGYGFKSQSSIGDKVIYKVENTDGLVSSSSFMGKLTYTQTRNAQGYESNVKVMCGTRLLENFDETYDGATGDLLTRKWNNSPQESFGYDSLDRLVSVKSGDAETMRVSYAPNGNILFKTGVGNYTYDRNIRPHAVTEVENADGKIPGEALNTSFNDFGKVQLIEDVGKNLRMDFGYGPDQERWYSEVSKNGKDVRSTVYAGPYEKVCENGKTREFYYLDGNTIAIRENGTVKKYLAFTDNIGSILSVVDENGTKVFDASYDAWGKQTVKFNTIGLHRGYTGHEMLSEFDIINMNGRLYDPVLGRFFSPDNYVQMPDNSQNFNRYSYCLNNPLKYTDPSGNLFGIIAFAAFSMGSSMMQASFEGKSVWKAGALSLLSSAASYGIGEAFKNVASTFGNELLRAGAHGLASGVVSALDGGNFVSSFVSGAAASGMGSYAQSVDMNTGLMVASTTAMGGVVAWITGNEFLQGAMQGMSIGLFNHAAHNRENETSPLKVSVKTNKAGTYEIFVIGSKKGGKEDAQAVAAGINTFADNVGMSLMRYGGNSSISNNGKLYFHAAGQRGFYGNQYVSVTKLTTTGRKINKFTGPVGHTLDIIEIYDGYRQDGDQIGYHTARASADVVGGWAGSWAGFKFGGIIGGSIGAVPGAIIGGFIGGVGGAFGGSYLGKLSIDKVYGR